jgi:hypothetical protein
MIIFLLWICNSSGILKKNELYKITGELEKTQRFEYGGSDDEDYIIFNIVNHKINYHITDCAYRVCKKDDILKLKKETQITFYVKEKEPEYGSKYIKIFSLSTNKNSLLSLEDYNKCKNSSRKTILFITGIVFIGVLCKIIIDIYHIIKFDNI